MADRGLGRSFGKIMNWYASRSDEFRSPIVVGEWQGLSPRERARERTLTDDGIRAVWANANGPFGAMVRFILLTACKRNEASDMVRGEIDGRDWTLPKERNKAKVDLLRPLSQAALAVLPEGNGFIFSPDRTKPFSTFSRSKRALDMASGTSGWTLHDCRRTARSLMSRAGVPSDHAERCLGHVIGGVRGIYDRHEYYDEKLKAFEAFSLISGSNCEGHRCQCGADAARPAMKTTIELQRNPNPIFSDVASIIAKGEPPQWLAPSLEGVSQFVSNGLQITPDAYRLYKKRIKRMQEAVDTLVELLPSFEKLPESLLPPLVLGFEESLFEFKEWLDQLSRSGKGRRSHYGRELCAATIVLAWRVIHSKAEPRSDKVYEACEEYWRACGNEPSGDIDNWRRMVEEASARDHAFATHNMLIANIVAVQKPRAK